MSARKVHIKAALRFSPVLSLHVIPFYMPTFPISLSAKSYLQSFNTI